jgi:hypothetical protein
MTAIDELVKDFWITEFHAGDEIELDAATLAGRLLRGAIAVESPAERSHHLRTVADDRATAGSRRAHAARGRRRSVRALGVGGFAAAVAAVALITQVFVHGGAGVPQSAAAAVLERAARVTLTSPPARLGPHRYWYEADDGTYLDVGNTRQGSITAYVSEIERYWIGADHWSRRETVMSVRSAEKITKPWQRAALKMFTGSPSMSVKGSSYDLPVSYARMLATPTSTRALRTFVLHAETAPGFTPERKWVPDILMNSIHDILIEPMVPARIRAGLYRVAATIPGIKLLGRVHDSLGRPAFAIGFADRDQQTEYELLFDPNSYVLLDAVETVIRGRSNSIPAGTVEGSTAYIAAGVVRRPGQTRK